MISRRLLLAAAPILALPGWARAEATQVRADLRGGLLFVRASIGSAPGLFLVDTGAPFTLLHETYAKGAGVKPQGGEVLAGVGGVRVAARAQRAVLALAGGPSAAIEASIIDLSAIAGRMQLDLAGVLGCDFLSRFVVTLDYRRGAIAFAQASPPPPRTAVTLRIGRTPYVRATAVYGAARAAGEFQIDTGANTAVVLWKPFAARSFPGVGAVSGAVQGVAGVSQARIGRLTALEVAGQRLVDLQANFADEVRPDDAGRDHAGVIGGPAFAGRRIIIDYPGQRFWFV